MNKWTCSCGKEIELRFNICPFCQEAISDKEIKRISKIEYNMQKKYFKELVVERNNCVFETVYYKYISKQRSKNAIIILLISSISVYSYVNGFESIAYRFSHTIAPNKIIEPIKYKYNNKISSNIKIRDLSNIEINIKAPLQNRKGYNLQYFEVMKKNIEKIIRKWRRIK